MEWPTSKLELLISPPGPLREPPPRPGPGGVLAGHVDGPHGHDRRERRAPRSRTTSPRARRPCSGSSTRTRSCSPACCCPWARSPDRLGARAVFLAGPRHLRRRVRPRRRRAVGGRADRRPGGARRRRGAGAPDVAGAAQPRLPGRRSAAPARWASGRPARPSAFAIGPVIGGALTDAAGLALDLHHQPPARRSLAALPGLALRAAAGARPATAPRQRRPARRPRSSPSAR